MDQTLSYIRTQELIKHYQSETINTTEKELLTEVQTLFNRNVSEYLKLSAKTFDEVELQNIRTIFEKKNLIIQKQLQAVTSDKWGLTNVE